MINFNPKWSDFKFKKWLREHFESADEVMSLVALRGADINALNPEHNVEPKRNHDALVDRISRVDVAEAIGMKSFVNGHELQKIFNRKQGEWIREVQGKMIDLQLQGMVNNQQEALARAQKWADRELEQSS
jgi:hypothetical protein